MAWIQLVQPTTFIDNGVPPGRWSIGIRRVFSPHAVCLTPPDLPCACVLWGRARMGLVLSTQM